MIIKKNNFLWVGFYREFKKKKRVHAEIREASQDCTHSCDFLVEKAEPFLPIWSIVSKPYSTALTLRNKVCFTLISFHWEKTINIWTYVTWSKQFSNIDDVFHSWFFFWITTTKKKYSLKDICICCIQISGRWLPRVILL